MDDVDLMSNALNRVRAPLPMKQVKEALSDTAENLGRRVRELREHAGLSQAALASEVSDLVRGKWHQTAVAKVEAGTRPLKVEELLALTFVFRQSSPTGLISSRTDDLLELMLNLCVETERLRTRLGERLLCDVLERIGVQPSIVDEALRAYRGAVPTPAKDLAKSVDRSESALDTILDGDDSEQASTELMATLGAYWTERGDSDGTEGGGQ